MKLEALIFDVDGTLAETEELHRQSFNLTFQQFKLDWDWDPDIYAKLLQTTGGKERMIRYVNDYAPDQARGAGPAACSCTRRRRAVTSISCARGALKLQARDRAPGLRGAGPRPQARHRHDLDADQRQGAAALDPRRGQPELVRDLRR